MGFGVCRPDTPQNYKDVLRWPIFSSIMSVLRAFHIVSAIVILLAKSQVRVAVFPPQSQHVFNLILEHPFAGWD
jgi:hypothetical protein